MEVTHTKAMTTEPVWNEDFRLRVFRNLELEVAVMSRGVGEQDRPLGSATIPALELLSGDAPPPSLVEDLSVETAPRPAARWGQTQIHFLSCSGTALFLTLCSKKGGHSTCLWPLQCLIVVLDSAGSFGKLHSSTHCAHI